MSIPLESLKMKHAESTDLLTILIPTRNRPELLSFALRSVLVAFGPGTQVIIGDNGNAEVTRAMLEKEQFLALAIVHHANPMGSSYSDNLQMLIDACQSIWLCVLHDDDFFVGSAQDHVFGKLADPAISFVFSDHWMARNDGSLDEKMTARNSTFYGRSRLGMGKVENLGELAVRNSICLDGFFMRTDLSRQRRLDLALPVFAQNKWMIEICDSCAGGYFLPDRLFAYRATTGSLTGQGMDTREILEAMMRTVVHDNHVKLLLRARIRAAWWKALKSSIRRGNFLMFISRFSLWRMLSI